MIWGDARLFHELEYVVPLGIPHSAFLGWDPADQDKALAWIAEQKKVCKGCGTRKTEWKHDKFAYVGQIEICPGCELLDMERDNIDDGTKGVKTFLAPRATAKPPDER